MREIRAEIEIAASADHVWRVLTDFDRYGRWNSFIPSVEGQAKVGARPKVYVRFWGRRGVSFRTTVLCVEPSRELRWEGRLLRRGLFGGLHSFTIEPLGENRVRFTQREVFTGALIPVIMLIIGARTRSGFEAMNRALKAWAEATAEPTETDCPSGG